ncbi:MAG: uracil-DNA glycosylase family protein [Panacagrimonas sp.]
MPEIPLKLDRLVAEIRACTVCSRELPLGPRPVVRLGEAAQLLVIGQAPGTRVHATGIPWNDASGERLRQWLELDQEAFYDTARIAIMPMGFCYPGRGRGGDLPPRPECAGLWHDRIRAALPQVRLTLLIGRYAQAHYLGVRRQTLEHTVRNFHQHLARGYFPLPHPSPRNTLWLKRRPWFEAEVLPVLRAQLRGLLAP